MWAGMSMRSSCGLVAASSEPHAVRSQPFCLVMSEREGTDLPVDAVATGETPQPTPIQVVGVADLAEHGTTRGPSGVAGGE